MWVAIYVALVMRGSGEQDHEPVFPLKPQRVVITSEHHCGPRGLLQPHVHNVVITALTGGVS
jgi:hypothetical protein